LTCCCRSFGKEFSRLRESTNTDPVSNEDVSETMYRETLKSKDLAVKSKLSQDQVDNKANRIADAFLAVLEQPQYKDEHLQNIITSHVSKVPPALEAGLDMIGRLQG
jgi:elongator complex protein 1